MVKSYNGPDCTILIDQGKEDDFLKKGQLLPENLVNSSKDESKLVSVNLRCQEVFYFIYNQNDIKIILKSNVLKLNKWNFIEISVRTLSQKFAFKIILFVS